MTEAFLIDASACHRLFRKSAVEKEWGPALDDALVTICEFTELELVQATSTRADHAKLRHHVDTSFAYTTAPTQSTDRALHVQELLRERGWHKGPGAIDLLVAATAELRGLTLLHYDADFETIAKVTGQPHRWIAVRGSVS